MAIQHGVNITASDMKNMLEASSYYNGENSWQKLYGNAALSYQNQSDQLLKTYGDTIASAYKSSLQQQNALYDLGLTQGDTQELQGIARQELMATYQNYLSNYQSAQNELANAYAQEKGLYDEALMTESENYANLYNSAMDYYEKVLKGATYTENDLSKPIYSGEGKEAQATGEYEQKTTSLVDEYGLDWLMKKAEDGSMVALSRNELMNKMFDEEGMITEYGRNFYDMVFNNAMYAGGYTDSEGNQIVSFDKWLSDNDNDLYNWLHSTDTFNYTHQGTKLGSVKEKIGVGDDEYGAFESVEGVLNDIYADAESALSSIEDFNTEEFTKAQVDFDDKFNDVSKLTWQGSTTRVKDRQFREAKESLTSIQGSMKQAMSETYSKVTSDLQKALGDDYSKYADELESLYEKYSGTDYMAMLDEGILTENGVYGSELTDRRIANFEQRKKNYANAYSSLKGSYNNFAKDLSKLVNRIYSERE